MKIGAPDFWKNVAETGSLPTTSTPAPACENIRDFWKYVEENNTLPVTSTPLSASSTIADFFRKVAAQGALPTTSTLVEFATDEDYWAYVAANGVMPISVGNVYENALDLWDAIVKGLSGDTPLTRLLSKFTGSSGEVGVHRVGLDYWLYTPIAGGRYAGYYLANVTISGFTAHSFAGISSRMPFLSVEEDDASVVRAGTWVNGSNAGAYGGDYSYSVTATNTATFTTPAGTRAVGIRSCNLTNCGVASVSIDGDLTRANRLSTAQALVDAGTLANTVLIANGGTLNPTDRVINTYGANNYDTRTVFADDLTAGVHTVVLTITGYKQAASSAARVYIGGMLYNSTSVTIATASIVVETLQSVCPSGSVYEYAFNITPTGASGAGFTGNGHGYETETSLSITVDGLPSTPADGEIVAGASIQAVRASNLFHPNLNAGVTQIGTGAMTYDLLANGVEVSWSVTWSIGGSAAQAYFAMCPTGIFMDKGANIGLLNQSVTLSNDNNSTQVNATSQAVYTWDSDGNYAMLLYIPNMADVSYYTYAANKAFIEDTTGGTRNKMYISYINGSPLVYAAGVWQCRAQYRTVWLNDANALAAI